MILLKFIFSEKATKIDEIFTVNLTLCSKCQIDGEDFVNFCGLLRKHELYERPFASVFQALPINSTSGLRLLLRKVLLCSRTIADTLLAFYKPSFGKQTTNFVAIEHSIQQFNIAVFFSLSPKR